MPNDKTTLRVAVLDVSLAGRFPIDFSNYQIELLKFSSEPKKLKEELEARQPDILVCSANSFVFLRKLLKDYPDIYFILALEEGKEKAFISDLYSGLVDNFILVPIRTWDLTTNLLLYLERREKKELISLNQKLGDMSKDMDKNIKLAQKIQLQCMRGRSAKVKNLSIRSKYWASLSNGGNYFDIFSLPSKNYLCFIMSDSSNITLSNAFLRSIISLPTAMKEEKMREPSTVVKYIFSNLEGCLKAEKDKFSIFYGVLDLKTYVMNYICQGNVNFIHQSVEGLQWLSDSTSKPLSKERGLLIDLQKRELILEPSDRLCLFSEGVQASEIRDFPVLLEKMKDEDAQLIINELGSALFNGSQEEDTMLETGKDCSLLFVNINKNVMRLVQES